MHISDAMPACLQQHKTAKFDALNNKLTLKKQNRTKDGSKIYITSNINIGFRGLETW